MQVENHENHTVISSRSNIVTFSAIGIVACALADMVHEVLGHLTAAWIVGVRINVMSTVAIQTAAPSRFVSSAGTTANLIVGALALVLFSQARRWTNWTNFLWLFSAFNLLNSGYLVFSAVSPSGDWGAVISGLQPAWVWRCGLGVVGAVLYVESVHWLTRSMATLVRGDDRALANVRSLAITGYLAGGVILTLASVFNPFSQSLILISGVGASFGLNAGLLFIPSLVKKGAASVSYVPVQTAAPSVGWIAGAVAVGVIFVAIFGPGIRFH